MKPRLRDHDHIGCCCQSTDRGVVRAWPIIGWVLVVLAVVLVTTIRG